MDRDTLSRLFYDLNVGTKKLEDIGTLVTKRSLSAIRRLKLGRIHGFDEGSENKIRVLQIPVGYAPDVVKTQAFLKYFERNVKASRALFDEDRFAFGYLMPDSIVSLTLYALSSYAMAPDSKEGELLLKRLERKFGRIDMVELCINPELSKEPRKEFSGISTPHPFHVSMEGPHFTGGVMYRPNPLIYMHERLHALSFLSIMRTGDPAFFGDAYDMVRPTPQQRALLENGNHSELFPETEPGSGVPIASNSPYIRAALEQSQPAFYESGIVLKDGRKLLTPNPLKLNIMDYGYHLDIVKREFYTSYGGEMISDFQRALFNIMANNLPLTKDVVFTPEEMDLPYSGSTKDKQRAIAPYTGRKSGDEYVSVRYDPAPDPLSALTLAQNHYARVRSMKPIIY